MTSRERVLAGLCHRQPDRGPRWLYEEAIGSTPPVERLLRQHCGTPPPRDFFGMEQLLVDMVERPPLRAPSLRTCSRGSESHGRVVRPCGGGHRDPAGMHEPCRSQTAVRRTAVILGNGERAKHHATRFTCRGPGRSGGPDSGSGAGRWSYPVPCPRLEPGSALGKYCRLFSRRPPTLCSGLLSLTPGSPTS